MQTKSLNINDDAKNLKLQAYERLSLYVQRITIPDVIYRLKKSDMTAKELNMALLITLQKELEHNNTQQIYVSNNLWQIISLARDESAHMINQAFEEVGPDASADELTKRIIEKAATSKIKATQQAAAAIKKEVDLILR